MSDVTTTVEDPAAGPGSGAMRNRWAKVAIAAVWVLAFVTWTLHLRRTGTSPADSAQGFIDTLDGAWWAIPAFVVAYLARPLLLFPASLLTIAAGILFGPVTGIAVAIVAANASVMVAFQIGRTFSPAAASAAAETSIIGRWAGRMRSQSFLTVMLMRLAYLPYDLVNYGAGYLRINPVAFLAATALGSLPGTVSFVLAGASLERLDAGLDGFDPQIFAISLAIFVVSLGVSKVVQRRAVPT